MQGKRVLVTGASRSPDADAWLGQEISLRDAAVRARVGPPE